ncbi:MAG: hypothetical protein CVT89_02795 [Candidatus Altiarchaeales archaeon HGW-Altiarchaeales-2]|nr:MAG: hypothetical protein CVT89_02795 [Candidatus Altiarchaeales archaeon HGW-Altiarchaeales-2]
MNGKNLLKGYGLLEISAVAAILILSVLISGCVNPGDSENKTINVEEGDQVGVYYIGKLQNGTIFDQSEEGNPLTFIVGSGQMIKGFEEAVTGMKVNETKNVTLYPENAYGEKDPKRVTKIPKVSIESIFIDNVPLSNFKGAIGKDPVINETYRIQQIPWPIRVVEIKNTTIKLKHEPVSGIVINIGFGEVTTVTTNETNLTLSSNPVVGTMLNTQSGVAVVSEVDNENITMDYNHPLAGKTLNFEIKLVKIKKFDKPEVEVFVMAYCPYGTQIEKGIIPVHELLKDKANISIRFVQYTMHGKTEVDENTRQYCIQKEQPDKYWGYLACFLEKGDSANCSNKLNIDKNKLQSCINEADKNFNISSDLASGAQYPRYRVNEDIALKYGVGGSPTVVINGAQVGANRDSESLKNAICNAFPQKKRPVECNQTLSSAPPAPGFGFSGTGSGSGGTCG